MTTPGPRFTVAVALASALGSTPCAAAELGVAFREALPPVPSSSEVVTVLEPAGGQFVYSDRIAAARPIAHFAVGGAARSDYTFFSVEEQRELQVLRDRLSPARPLAANGEGPSPAPPKRRRRAARPASARGCPRVVAATPLAGLAGSEVMQDGPGVCVPRPGLADRADWRDHVWCVDMGDGRVR